MSDKTSNGSTSLKGRLGPFIGVAVVLSLIAGCQALVNGAGSDQSGYVKVACRDWVKEQLRSPGSAEFSGEDVSDDGNGQYTVYGAVDSQNAFGGMVRNTYTCVAVHTGESTRLVSLTGLTN